MAQTPATIDDRVYPPHKVALLVGILQEDGIAPGDALNGSGLDAPSLLSPATRISYRQLLTVIRNTQKLSHDPAIALRAARRIRLSSFGIFGYALVSSPNARDAADLYIRYQKLAAPLLGIRMLEEGDTAAWVYDDIFGLDPGDDLCRFVTEFTIVAGVSFAQDVMGADCQPVEVRVQYPAPPYAASYRTYLDCPVHFGQPVTEARYDAAWLDRRPNLANPLTAAMLHEMCDRMLSEMNMTSGVASRVHGLLLQNPGQFLKEDEVARELCMVSRTLRRKLEAEGTSFKKILDDVRKHIAIRYLRETRMTTEDIAAALGFSEVATFRHAFKRWTGKTPGDFKPD